MTDLLRKWAELEPNRFRLFGDSNTDGEIMLYGRSVRVYTLAPSRVQEACLLAAVIEAIEARGWDCRLTSNQLREGDWHAVVWVGGRLPRFRQPRPSLDGFGPTPAVALLGAYLAALAAGFRTGVNSALAVLSHEVGQ